MATQELPAVVTVSEAAAALRCSVHTVRRAIQAGRLPAVRLAENGPLRIPEAELRRFVAGGEEAA